MKGRPTFSKFYYYFAFSMDDGPLIAAGNAGSSHLPTLGPPDSTVSSRRAGATVQSTVVQCLLHKHSSSECGPWQDL